MAEEHSEGQQKLLERVTELEGKLSISLETLELVKKELIRKDQIIAGLQHRLFGAKSERHHPDQPQLDFGEDVLGKSETPCEIPAGQEDDPEGEGAKKGSANRRNKKDLFPRFLPVVVVDVVVPDEVKANPDAYIEIGEFHHDELTVQRAQLYWRRQTRKKFKSKEDRSLPPLVAPAPLPSVPGTMCDPDLIAMIIADKYFYHDPQYRQSTRFLMRFGAILSRQTLNQWTHAGMDLLAPVGEAILQELRLAEVIQADETPMAYLDPGHGSTSQGYLWWYRDAASGTAYCDWQLGRGHNCLIDLLGLDDEAVMCNVRMIQCDGYSAYEALANRYREILLAACLAHIRRKFIEAFDQAPEEAGVILALIRRLYQIERQLRNGVATASCRMLVRQGRARLLVKQLKEKILAEHGRHLPRSKFGEALTYALGQWGQFERYLSEGVLEIDNNLTENLIRPSKLGLKNYLFFGSAEAGSGSALIYTLIANCRVQGIDPERYLAEAMRRLSPNATSEQAAELTPAKLAPLIRQLQPRPACADKQRDDALASAA
jgi:transposase